MKYQVQQTNNRISVVFRIMVIDPSVTFEIKAQPADVSVALESSVSIDTSSFFSATSSDHCVNYRVNQIPSAGVTMGLPLWMSFDIDTKTISGTPSSTDFAGTENPCYIEVTCINSARQELTVTQKITITNNAVT